MIKWSRSWPADRVGPLLLLGHIRLNHERMVSAGLARAASPGSSEQRGNNRPASTDSAAAPQHQQRDDTGSRREDERNAVDAHERSQAQRQRHIDACVAERRATRSRTFRACARCRSTAPRRPELRSEVSSTTGGEQAEQRQVQRLQHAEQRKCPPTSPMSHAAVDFENELNPIADARTNRRFPRTRRAADATTDAVRAPMRSAAEPVQRAPAMACRSPERSGSG